MVKLFRSQGCELPCSELNDLHHISGPQTTHLDCLFFRSIRIINLCAFLSLFTVIIHARAYHTPGPPPFISTPIGEFAGATGDDGQSYLLIRNFMADIRHK